jgi:general stress protein 26
MEPEILEFLASQRVGVLAVEMLDGSPHGATVHYAHADKPVIFYFETNRSYRKAEPLFGREVTRASFVVGTDAGAKKTLQLDGTVQLLAPEQKEMFDAIYYEKFPTKKEKASDPTVVMFKFVPTWWRYTDWTVPDGKKILMSA